MVKRWQVYLFVHHRGSVVVNIRKRIPQTRRNVVNGSKVYVLTTDELGNGNVQTVNHVSPKLCREEHEYRSER